ncbi:hypothetical protein FG379_000473 [Cryptosporidium bovis]|uniref:uncharacterized protein n=1 Tax=Cryptosporidium bovis TaxID=310047 RepID=UPI00351A5ADC|nr:hypothetical protein FG379_000473 [Cryptosporidium bovis]
MKDRIHELIDLLAKAQNTLPDSSLSKVEIPLGLVKHIDAGNSPNVWLMDLLKLLTEQQDKARGEFSAIRTLHEALCKRLVHKHVLTVNDIDIINENDFENGGT